MAGTLSEVVPKLPLTSCSWLEDMIVSASRSFPFLLQECLFKMLLYL